MPPLTPVVKTGTLVNNGDVVTVPLRALTNGGASIQLTGTWTGTVTFQVSADQGVTYVALTATSYASAAASTTATINGTFWANVVGVTHVQVKATAAMTGTVSVLVNAMPG